MSKFLGVFLLCSEGKKERISRQQRTHHPKYFPLFRTPDNVKSDIPFVQMALQTEKNYFQLNYAFHIADTDTDKNYLGINFS